MKIEDIEEKLVEFGIENVSKALPTPKTNWHTFNYIHCKKHFFLPLYQENNKTYVATSNPLDLDLEKSLMHAFQTTIEFQYLEHQMLFKLIEKVFKKNQEESYNELKQNLTLNNDSPSSSNCYDLLSLEKEEHPTIKLINYIIQQAVEQRASDIHFEPIESILNVRYRIDGVLQNKHQVPQEFKAKVISRLKVMAKLDIAETRRPQDGRLKLKLGNHEIDFRMSSLKVACGERIVLRILDKKNINFGLKELSIDPKTLNQFKALIYQSSGIILVTGPTGSGKTTTLYSTLTEIYRDSLNIMTIEDPIEYNLPKIAQMGVEPKINLTFSKGLKHILRQDPDVIMIGEIRDLETAKIAVQAALTGHLVLSTLHTNDAPSAVTRLVDMQIEPYLINSSLIGVLAQRLLRKLCPSCKSPYMPDQKEMKILNLIDPKQIFKACGCSKCFNTGYRDRQGIYELMTLNESLKSTLAKTSDGYQIKQKAIECGMQTLSDQAIKLVICGITSIEEMIRVTLKS